MIWGNKLQLQRAPKVRIKMNKLRKRKEKKKKTRSALKLESYVRADISMIFSLLGLIWFNFLKYCILYTLELEFG